MNKPNSKHMEWATKIRSALGRISTFHFTDEIAQHLAAFEAEVTGWRTDMENAPRDGTVIDVVLSTNNRPVRETNCYYLEDRLMKDHYEQGPLPVETNSIKAFAWREITLPAQPEKEGE